MNPELQRVSLTLVPPVTASHNNNNLFKSRSQGTVFHFKHGSELPVCDQQMPIQQHSAAGGGNLKKLQGK